MKAIWYGEYAPRRWLNVIREDFVGMTHEIDEEQGGPGDTIGQISYQGYFTRVWSRPNASFTSSVVLITEGCGKSYTHY